MIPRRVPAYALLADFLEYPQEAPAERAATCARLFAQRGDGVARSFEPFLDGVRELSLEETQELYTRTFDINPVCTLEVGWHVYGEDYARGEFLVRMRQLLRKYDLPESKELPDHITHVLALLCHLPQEEADDLAARYVLPALGKMLAGMKKDEENPYRALLDAILESVRSDHNVQEIAPRQRRGDPPGWASPMPVFGPGGPPGAGCNGGPSAGCGGGGRPDDGGKPRGE